MPSTEIIAWPRLGPFGATQATDRPVKTYRSAAPAAEAYRSWPPSYVARLPVVQVPVRVVPAALSWTTTGVNAGLTAQGLVFPAASAADARTVQLQPRGYERTALVDVGGVRTNGANSPPPWFHCSA